MELDWTTFILEIINFLVLVWILQRFLYKPVLNVVAQRRAAIAASVEEVQAAQREAASLKDQYENRLADWQKEREEARRQLRGEIDAERQKLLEQLQAELAEQRRKEQALAARRTEDLSREARQEALRLSDQFAAKLLSRLADPAVEGRLLDMLLEDLNRVSDAQRQPLAEALRGMRAPVRIVSAFPLSDSRRQALISALQKLLTAKVDCEFGQDPALLAGVSIHIGAQRLQANLKEELRFFGAAVRHEQ